MLNNKFPQNRNENASDQNTNNGSEILNKNQKNKLNNIN